MASEPVKVIIATSEKELPALARIEQRGRDNGLKGVVRLTAEEVKEHEPHVRGIAGLHVPETGIARLERNRQQHVGDKEGE